MYSESVMTSWPRFWSKTVVSCHIAYKGSNFYRAAFLHFCCLMNSWNLEAIKIEINHWLVITMFELLHFFDFLILCTIYFKLVSKFVQHCMYLEVVCWCTIGLFRLGPCFEKQSCSVDKRGWNTTLKFLKYVDFFSGILNMQLKITKQSAT